MGKARPIPPLPEAVLETFRTNDKITRFLVESLDEKAWRAEPPTGKGRTVAAIVAHIHNVRHMWLTVSAKGVKCPPKVDRDKVTRAQALKALERSGRVMAEFLGPALAGDGRIKNFPQGAAAFIAYAISHEAHHRGQIAMLARQAGFALPQAVMFGMWEWGKL